MDDRQFDEVYLPKYKASIQAMARKLARRDQELFKDLYQEGMIALWRLSPAKAKDNEDAWVRQALWNNMVSWLRREHRRDFDSLDSLIEHGAQILDSEDGAQIIAMTRTDARADSWGNPGEDE